MLLDVLSVTCATKANEATEVLVSAPFAPEWLGTMRQQHRLLPLPRWAHPSVGEAVGTRAKGAPEQVRLLLTHEIPQGLEQDTGSVSSLGRNIAQVSGAHLERSRAMLGKFAGD